MTLIEAEDIVADTLARSHKGFQINTKKYYDASEVIAKHRGLDATKHLLEVSLTAAIFSGDQDESDVVDESELEPKLPDQMEGSSDMANT